MACTSISQLLSLFGLMPLHRLLTYVVYGDGEAMSYAGRLGPFNFPPSGYPIMHLDGFELCRRPLCRDCPVSLPLESATVHYECMAVFLHYSSDKARALSRLWTVECCRHPWAKAPLLHLRDNRPIDPAALEQVACVFGLPRLPSLPPELLHIIRRCTLHAFFWRAIATVSRAIRPVSQSQRLLPLDSVGLFERGKQFAPIPPVLGPVVRISIDAEGIRTIERLPRRSDISDGGSRHMAYIVEEETPLRGVHVLFKVRPPP